jgi:hypothetical protein
MKINKIINLDELNGLTQKDRGFQEHPNAFYYV